MTCIYLAAGYATRLYPLTENFPKPLLKIKNKPIIDWLFDDIDGLEEITGHVIISNHKFYEHFLNWSKNKKTAKPVVVLDDGSTDNENRLGAVVDIQFAVEKLNIDDDIFVVAGDNITDFSFGHFIDFFKEKKASVIMTYLEPDLKKRQKCGIVTFDEKKRIISMVEKPENPPTGYAVPPFYIYIKNDVKKIREALEDNCGTDAPGSLVSWLCKKSVMYVWEMRVNNKAVNRYDIGNLESYKEIERILLF